RARRLQRWAARRDRGRLLRTRLRRLGAATRFADAFRATCGKRSEHAVGAALGIRFPLGRVLRHRSSSVRPSAVERRISDLPKTGAGSPHSQRLDSASTAVGEGGQIALTAGPPGTTYPERPALTEPR